MSESADPTPAPARVPCGAFAFAFDHQSEVSELDQLTAHYEAWLKDQGLTKLGCALEALHGEEGLSIEQRQWLSSFVLAWEEAEDRYNERRITGGGSDD